MEIENGTVIRDKLWVHYTSLYSGLDLMVRYTSGIFILFRKEVRAIDIKALKLMPMNRLYHTQGTATKFIYKPFSMKGYIEIHERELSTSTANAWERLNGVARPEGKLPSGCKYDEIVKSIRNWIKTTIKEKISCKNSSETNPKYGVGWENCRIWGQSDALDFSNVFF